MDFSVCAPTLAPKPAMVHAMMVELVPCTRFVPLEQTAMIAALQTALT
jgi:hypothetical protein